MIKVRVTITLARIQIGKLLDEFRELAEKAAPPASLNSSNALTEFKDAYQQLRSKAASKISQVFYAGELAKEFLTQTEPIIADEAPSRKQEKVALSEAIHRGIRWLTDVREKGHE